MTISERAIEVNRPYIDIIVDLWLVFSCSDRA